jgi:magnesium chelatase accessory protein
MNVAAGIPSFQRAVGQWPNGEVSQFVRAAGMTWHVQEFGRGPVALLLHGTGASTHSWRQVAPLLAQRFNVVAIDLPGHGLSQMPQRELMSLYGMARATKTLLTALGKTPALVIGHSAGAAIAARMSLDNLIAPKAIVGLNGALLPLSGYAGQFFAPLARMLTRIPVVPKFFARRAFDRSLIETMIGNTGSTLDAAGIDYYHQLAQRPGHVAAALAMMAEWDLPKLQRDLKRLKTPLVLIVGTGDRTIPPSDARRVQAILPQTIIAKLNGLGHLAHEEAPELTVRTILRITSDLGIALPAGDVHA